MSLVLQSIYKSYIYLNEARDTRFEHYLLMGSPVQVIVLIGAFLYFVKNIGPKMMLNRKPYELKTVMVVYNLFQVIANFALASTAIYLIAPRFKFKCMPLDFSNTPDALLDLKLSYYYFLLKVSDLLDTVFFILRKKDSHLSFLHIYHHVMMVGVGYFFVNFAPGGHGFPIGVINCLVHVIMYFYYFLTCINPSFKSSLWWKKHITQAQLTQFAILVIHFGHPLVFGNCSYPKILSIVAIIQNAFMIVLFSDFYYRAYIKKSPKGIKNVE